MLDGGRIERCPAPAHEENLRAFAGYWAAGAVDHLLWPRSEWTSYDRTTFGCLVANAREKQSLWDSVGAGLYWIAREFMGCTFLPWAMTESQARSMFESDSLCKRSSLVWTFTAAAAESAVSDSLRYFKGRWVVPSASSNRSMTAGSGF